MVKHLVEIVAWQAGRRIRTPMQGAGSYGFLCREWACMLLLAKGSQEATGLDLPLHFSYKTTHVEARTCEKGHLIPIRNPMT